MKRKWLRRAVLSLMACSAIAGIVPGAEAADVRILPIDTAKFVPGAKFDFDVEVANATDLKNVDITIMARKQIRSFVRTFLRNLWIMVSCRIVSTMCILPRPAHIP